MKFLTPVVVTGSPHDIGRQLGELARPAMDAYIAQSGAWRAVARWRGHPFVAELRRAAEAAFPALVAELDGIAAGLCWHAQDVFVWNCRGELIHNAPDGCTTLAACTPRERMIAHNEDGDPHLRGKCMLVDVRPDGKPGFVGFYYPGSLPGHTFAASRAGLVQTINNVRIRRPAAGVPRMIAARAVLDAASLDDALRVLRDTPHASGFHHMLGCAGDARIVSVEASVARTSVLAVEGVYGHANHLIHPGGDAEAQIVTASSADRQARLAQLLPPLRGAADASALWCVLADRAGGGLPIYRDDPDDPDDENTLATALFSIGDDGVAFEVRERGRVRFQQFVPRDAQRPPVHRHERGHA
ncbi:peptidase C45 [Burkholderia pseudomallei MSHR338]|uniref:C45 family autoproteolytic acyltransferase/hydolase n=1 Tax=Burkholderia pseudomallei TaxID=28450 RepID=UPI0001A422C7|nr:C45 family peptidase [Burkholderia pseudomallei]AIP08434.1 acyl-coenzyme A:6-aminopenicillanic acid acyl-transferase family protein [Burkholderia pseudomallei]EEP52172.1 putative acyl-coenzyme A:6-aminopenicillanic acid acyl-transferase subfamily [Burkholderia pseudomallei MSHR346]EQA85691.1 peptidase C45 [Burkholderia pseudomallei MSHR338]OMW26685.1 peptidase C45 [Burkholderia pseudomallei]ONA21299.1 peptidase C45 [Burkholderia pseudomallei]